MCLCEENIDSDDDNFDFCIYNDVTVDLESSYSDSSDSDILAPGRRRKIRKLSSSDGSADDGELQQENLTKSICNVRSSDWQEIFNKDIIPLQFEFSTGTKIPGPQVHNLCVPIQYFQLCFTNAERGKEKASCLFTEMK
ncbi:uncharacterized protein LOC117151988 [Bombus impatiens]|uniref:Uncharacterized protein LOC117151988 n=1 Tax=Bombus impatiens TaxID=132113 RepID=A0A6P8L2M9_BOMIM|nr:uncharacterized protein LOC117151988 [Bombus impatiens]